MRTQRLFQISLFMTAVGALYFGGFVYDELGPLVYALGVMMVASIPLLLKVNFWKQIIFGLPMLVIRVLARYSLSLFGKNTLSFLTTRYTSVAEHYITLHRQIIKAKIWCWSEWRKLNRRSRAYLIVIFSPVAIAVALVLLVMELFRLKLLQLGIEKIMAKLLDLIPHGINRHANDSLQALKHRVGATEAEGNPRGVDKKADALLVERSSASKRSENL